MPDEFRERAKGADSRICKLFQPAIVETEEISTKRPVSSPQTPHILLFSALLAIYVLETGVWQSPARSSTHTIFLYYNPPTPHRFFYGISMTQSRSFIEFYPLLIGPRFVGVCKIERESWRDGEEKRTGLLPKYIPLSSICPRRKHEEAVSCAVCVRTEWQEKRKESKSFVEAWQVSLSLHV